MPANAAAAMQRFWEQIIGESGGSPFFPFILFTSNGSHTVSACMLEGARAIPKFRPPFHPQSYFFISNLRSIHLSLNIVLSFVSSFHFFAPSLPLSAPRLPLSLHNERPTRKATMRRWRFSQKCLSLPTGRALLLFISFPRPFIFTNLPRLFISEHPSRLRMFLRFLLTSRTAYATIWLLALTSI